MKKKDHGREASEYGQSDGADLCGSSTPELSVGLMDGSGSLITHRGR